MINFWNDLSLRFRLTLLYTGLLGLLLVVFGSVLYFDTRNFMISTTTLRLQAQVQSGIDRLSEAPAVLPTQPGTSKVGGISAGDEDDVHNFSELAKLFAQSQTSADTTATVFDKNGQVVANGKTQSEQPVPAPPDPAMIARTLSGERGINYLTSVSGQNVLVTLFPVHGHGSQPATIGVAQLTTRLALVDDVLARQRLLILAGLVVTLILGTVGGLWLTSTALAPLQLMIRTCSRIARGDLSQRVNLPRHRDEIGKLATSFDEMVAQLDETFAAQRQFIADASHELRTPLTAIAGSLDVILLGPEGDPKTTHRMLNGMRRELQRLTRLVNDLLTLSRLDAHPSLQIQTVDLSALAREVAEQIKPVADSRTIQIESSGDTHVQGDSDKLKQVLLNLVDNAVRFTDPKSGEIRMGVYDSLRSVRLTVSDNGSGISPEAQPHLFERFYRVDKARARASGGSGLGLAIVQAIVLAHGGTVEPVKSAIGRGSVFAVSIPRNVAVPMHESAYELAHV